MHANSQKLSYQKRQSGCGDGSNLIDNSRNRELKCEYSPIKIVGYNTKSKSEKLREASIEKSGKLFRKVNNLIIKNKG